MVHAAVHWGHRGKIGKWETLNNTMHYHQGKNDTFCYSYDMFSSFSYHKQLTSKNCRALILSGDHDMTFPYVGVERWITSLNLGVAVPWKPFYVDGQVGGYDMKYARNDYTLTFCYLEGRRTFSSILQAQRNLYVGTKNFISCKDRTGSRKYNTLVIAI
nr:serine carboxypeptidase-like 13 [Tanacetum cinerariifolium]